ncbi:MAG TPA: STAS domain-containing protein [Baekduia sp.]|nr:STAS domain-containing protein [Baekduia sp.]
MAIVPQDLQPDAPDFSVRTKVRGATRTVAVRGELDLGTADVVGHRLATALQEHPELVVVDLSEVTFMDSTGVSLLVRARSRAERHDVRLVIVASPRVEAVVELCGLNGVLALVPPF